MAALPNTHECDINIPVATSISLDDTQPNQPPRPAKEVEVVPTYHPRTGYLNLLAYAACNLVSPLPTEGPAVSSSKACPVETLGPPSNRPPFLPITNNQEKPTSAHTSKSKFDKVLAPLSPSTPPLNESRRGPLIVRIRVRPQHPYKDSSYALRSSKKTTAKKGVSQIESSNLQDSQKTRQNEGNSIASRRPKRRTSS